MLKSFQETFDQVLNRLRELNGSKAVDDRGSCCYRIEGKVGCPIGALIPEEMYSENMEAHGANDWPVKEALEILGYDPDFCRFLQTVHDKVQAHRWEDTMYLIAKDLGLHYIAPYNHQFAEGIDSIDSASILGRTGIYGSPEEVATLIDTFKRQDQAYYEMYDILKQVNPKVAPDDIVR